MKIGIVGNGVVGNATARSYLEHVDEVRVHDTVPERNVHSLEAVLECDLVFVCLPTPQQEDAYAADVSALDAFFFRVRRSDARFVLRSTVPVGTTRRLCDEYRVDVVHSPEFLTARCSTMDAQLPARNIVGSPRHQYKSLAQTVYEKLLLQRFPHVPLLSMSCEDSELVKLTLNAFFAVKVAFFNEARKLADACGANWGEVLQGVLVDGRLASSHTKVPGPDGKRGFGGACLPKDAANFAACCFAAGLQPHVVRAALLRNKEDRP